jgi:hypothetical protein
MRQGRGFRQLWTSRPICSQLWTLHRWICAVARTFSRFSDAAATTREDHRTPRTGRAVRHRRWGRERPSLSRRHNPTEATGDLRRTGGTVRITDLTPGIRMPLSTATVEPDGYRAKTEESGGGKTLLCPGQPPSKQVR